MVPISLPRKITLGYIGVPKDALEKVMKYYYATTFDSDLDNAVLEIEDEFLKDPQIVFAALVDNNGYLPSHNSRYSKNENIK